MENQNQNQKKNSSPDGEQTIHKNNRPRHRGYFIEPPANKAPRTPHTPPDLQAKSSANDLPGGKEQPKQNARQEIGIDKKANPGGNRPNNRNRNRSKPKKPQKTASPAEPIGNSEAKAVAQESTSAERLDQTKGGKKDNRAPRQRSANHNNRPHHTGGKTGDILTPMPSLSKKAIALEADDEYEEVSLPNETADTLNATADDEDTGALVEVVGIRFKNSGKTYYFAPGELTVRKGDHAIVETARGQEYGEVSIGNTHVRESATVPPLRPIIRLATKEDHTHHLDNQRLEEDAFRICNQKIAAHGLDMKLIDAQYTFDNTKLLFYFTSAGRVDFRVLVKDLASVFRTRIELRQIGIRDEAKLLGGIGMCGRPLCCSRFLSDFGQVSIKMAKEQNLSLNSAKISGICGRLMCCLRYEQKTYEYEIKRTPPVDSVVRTADGNGTVTEINPLVGTVKVRLHASPEVAPKTYSREDVILLKKKTPPSEESKSES